MSDVTRKACVSASHRALFAAEDPSCAVCQGPLDSPVETDGYALDGEGLLMWARGDERRWETPPLCSFCATAIGVAALSRWEIEDDEE